MLARFLLRHMMSGLKMLFDKWSRDRSGSADSLYLLQLLAGLNRPPGSVPKSRDLNVARLPGLVQASLVLQRDTEPCN